MTHLDERLSEAVTNLRDDVGRLDPPPFAPRRSTTPAVLGLIVLLAIGAVGYLARSGADESGGFSVATQPDAPDDATVTDAAATVLTGPITAAEPGEFLMPIPAGVAWSNDETRLLMYRTGESSPGHFVVDATTGQEIAELPFAPTDIEQLYWHPSDDNLLLYSAGADLMAYDLLEAESVVVHSFAGCDRVDSGVLPVPPAADGTISVLCHLDGAREQVTFDLATGQEMRTSTTSDTAALPSPSGRNLVRWNADGSASVLNRDLSETGVVLATAFNLFGFVTDGSGREWIATTLFDGPIVGSVVLLPLDGVGPPVAVIGPEHGDSYPPTGTRISSVGNVVAISIVGPDDGALAGRVTRVKLGDSFDVIERSSIAHESAALHEYWSTPFLSLSPSGDFVVYSTDLGGDQVDAFVVDLRNAPG